MYGNAQKPIFKGGAAWFLGTKYISDGFQFIGSLNLQEANFWIGLGIARYSGIIAS
jgi:hypothetical protein